MRNSKGQYQFKPFKHSNWSGLRLLLLTVSTGAIINWYYTPPQVPPSPCPDTGCVMPHVPQVKAVETIVEPQTVEEYITYKFGSKADEALKIARCESQRDGKIQTGLIGDTHLMSMNNGELVGDSIGVFQIRTGGRGWNRAKANGMTADEFRVKLKDFKYNIDYAKTIYDNANGWTPWLNCMRKVL